MKRPIDPSLQAPLMSVTGSAPPEGAQAEWWRGAGGLRLRAAFWKPKGRTRGTVILSPGRTETIEKYYETIADFIARGWCVLAHDWRGQGLSARLLPDRMKGHARAIEEFLDDYDRLLDLYEKRAPKPWIMVGHSMGAALNLLTLEGGEPRIDAAVLTGPMLKITTGKRSMFSARLATRWSIRNGRSTDYVLGDPDDPFSHNFDEDALTRDETRYERFRQHLFACPHLALGGVTWGWLSVALEIGDRALKVRALRRVKQPVVIVQGADDSRVWKQTNKWAAQRLPRGRYVEVAGAEHEILVEEDSTRAIFFEAFDAVAAELRADARAGQKAEAAAEEV